MIKETRHYKVQLAVVGSGLAGFAASVFALGRGIDTAQVGSTGSIAYTTGYLDLLGYHRHRVLDSPWDGLARLRLDEPMHPLSRIGDREITAAFIQFIEALGEFGMDYSLPGERNLLAWSPVGTLKPTFSAPRTMLPGIEARKANAKVLIMGLLGLQGFSANEFVANSSELGSRVSATRIGFPDMDGGAQLFPEVMARALEVPAHRKKFAERIKAKLGNADIVGLPAIMGIHAPGRVHADLERLVGVPLFEIPTIPPGVPGIRLREAFEQQFPERGLTLVPQQKVKRIELSREGAVLYLRDSYGDVVIEAQTALLATGRFLSGGLKAGREGVREPLLGIPVSQPGSRNAWYQESYFDPRGHEINRSGIEVDAQFRPLGENGSPIGERLFAAGILLAHQDWIRQRCGAGVAIASAYRAVQSVSDLLSLPR